MNREDLKRHLVAAIEFEGAQKIGAVFCPDPGHPPVESSLKSLHEVETWEGKACLGCGAAV